MEFRIKDCELQAEDDGTLKIGGYINVTERESEMLYNKRRGKWFKEIMKKGVFKRAIQEATKNIPLLYEHDWSKKLASIEEGNLILAEDNIGLRFDATIKDEKVYQEVRAGVINSCSFGFRALVEEVENINSKLERRFVNAIELMEVSLVKNPAYVGSLCETRSYEEERANCESEKEKKREQDVEEKETNQETEPSDDKVLENKESEISEKKDEEKQEEKEESDKRFNEGEDALVEAQPTLDKEYIAQVVEELIASKLKEIANAEDVEKAMNIDVQNTKEFHQEIERELENNSLAQSAEVLRLRVQLLKLKEIKRGI